MTLSENTASSASRIRTTFGLLNALMSAILLNGMFVAVRTRVWAVDVPVALLGALLLASAIGLLANTRWSLALLRVAAWASFVFGLIAIALLLLTIAFLRAIHGDYGFAATATSELVIALAVPYAIAIPVLELLWLGKRVGLSA
jgi:hypothetical protein